MFTLFPFQKRRAHTDTTFQNNNRNPNTRSIASLMMGRCKKGDITAARTSEIFDIGKWKSGDSH